MEQFKGQPRLPKFAVPKRYDIHLKPDLSACTFAGSVAIDLDIVADTKYIVLNAAELSVVTGSVSFTNRGFYKVLEPSKIDLVEADEILVLEFAETLPIGIGVLRIGFEGTLNDKMKGFYRSKYEHNGEKKNMAVTQFEPADARRCFPCWDEPACKATFKITLDVPSELVALSNMPIVEEKVNGHLKTVSYQESPIMSTYLVAVVVGLFDYVEDCTSDGVKVRVYCQVGKANHGKFALTVAVGTLELYKEYFAVPYSLPKLDMVAIPDFAAGAMENYGLVTYRETALLYDDQHSAAANKQRVATVVAHELAHQWFGNLVTMEWWTHLWLNEGFATWVSYLATDSLFPEWKIWTQFLDESTEGLRLDGLAESHPIEVEINHAGEIDEIFDAISYRKGASVIRMLQSYLGAESFQRSLASYIKKYACSNAKTEDLWAALEEGSGEPVNKLMNSWTKQKGYPVVSVKVKDEKLAFEQSQFLSSGSHGDGHWIVPITLCCGSYDARKNFLLQTKSETLDIKEFLSDRSGAASAWIKINVDQTGFYRVKYDEDLSGRLRYAIESKNLSATDRFGILDDSFALCMARQQSLTSLLTLMGAYSDNPCRFEHTKGVIDLSSLASTGGARFKDVPVGPSSSWVYSYNPCKPFSEGAECVNVAACQVSQDQKFQFGLGTQDSAKWDAGAGLGGKPSVSYSKGEKNVQVSLACDRSVENPTLEALGESPTNFYKFTLTHKCACWDGCSDAPPGPGTSTKSPSGGGGGGGIGGGAVFVIILLVLVFVYLVGFALFYRFRQQKSGLELIPHRTFWGSLPGYARAGTVFVWQRVTGKGNSNYSAGKSGRRSFMCEWAML